MRKRIVLAVLAMVMVASLAACGKEKYENKGLVSVGPVKEDTAEFVATLRDLNEESDRSTKPVIVTAEMLTEEEYESWKNDGATLLESGETEYAAHILVTMDQDVSSMVLWSLFSDFAEGDAEPSITEETVLAELKSVKAKEAVIITTSLGEILPTAGFSFVDSEGILNYYYLGESGKDGSAICERYAMTPTDN